MAMLPSKIYMIQMKMLLLFLYNHLPIKNHVHFINNIVKSNDNLNKYAMHL